MSLDLRLAEAQVVDLPAVMRVMDAAFDPLFGEAWTSTQLLTLFALPKSRICLAWNKDVLCGFAAARIAGPESELLLLAVDPSWRGRGVGTQLIADWHQWAEKNGADDYFLEMRADNDAIHLYICCGFSECGRRKDYYKGRDGIIRDAITMRCSKKAAIIEG